MPVDGRDFLFPESLLEPMPLNKILDEPPPPGENMLPSKLIQCLQTETARRNYESAKATAKKKGMSMKKDPVFVDIYAGKEFTQGGEWHMPHNHDVTCKGWRLLHPMLPTPHTDGRDAAAAGGATIIVQRGVRHGQDQQG